MFYLVELLEESDEILCVISVFVLQLRNLGHIEASGERPCCVHLSSETEKHCHPVG